MDTIADFLIRIKNASMAQLPSLACPFTRFNEELAHILKKEGFIDKIEITGEGKNKKIVLTLNKEKNKINIINAKRISKPGRRVYLKAKGIRSLRGFGITIISTPKGLMSTKEALKNSLGGEVICKID